MGRPLHKKYFGNRNIGTTGTSDNKIGGEGVARVTINTAGTYTASLPTASFSTPDIPRGIRATGTVHGNALTAVATAAGSGYNLNNVLTLPSGSGVVAPATFIVTGLKVVSITLKNGGTANDVGDIFTFNNNNWPTAMRVRVTASSGGTATAVEIVDGGVLVTGALPGATDAGGFTRVQTFGSQDMNGQGLQVNITGWGVATVAVAQQGDYTTISSGAKATTVTPSGGSGATLTVTYGVSGVVVNEKGSGYTSPTDAAVTFSGGAAAGTAVLTTDSGAVGSATNQENAIIIHANTANSGVKIGDIKSQRGTRRYRVITADGTAVCSLVANASPTVKHAYIKATDANGNTYFVTKLTERRVVLHQWTRNGGQAWLFETNESAKWTFGAAQSGSYKSVTVENA